MDDLTSSLLLADEASAIAMLCAKRFAAEYDECSDKPLPFTDDVAQTIAALAQQRLDSLDLGWRVHIWRDPEMRQFILQARRVVG